MKHIATLLLVLGFYSTLYGQNNTCATATPYVDESFIPYNPPTGWVELYRRFVSPASSVDFAYTAFPAQGTCPVIDITYSIWDASCNLVDQNTTGDFTGLFPGVTYILGYTASCTEPTIGLILTSETLILPVALVNFTARPNINGMKLSWSTAVEINNQGFLLERSTDLSKWLNVGFVEGAGYSNRLINYEFVDTRPVAGVNYYRLTQLDRDGNFEICPTIAIMWNENLDNGPFRLYNFIGQKVGF